MTGDDPALRAELERLAVGLGGTAPDEAFPSTERLRRELSDAAVLGLGEASHGTREFFECKHRLLRYLVEETGLRAFGLEEDFQWMRRVDDYVTTGEGDLRELFAAGEINWPWKVEELVECFEWVRSFNASRPADDQVRVYGFDTASFERAASALETYLDRVDADVGSSTRAKLASLAADDGADDRSGVAPETLAEMVASSLAERFDDREAAWVERTSRRAFEMARHQCRLLGQEATRHRAGDAAAQFAARDEAMAENVSWVLDRTDADRIAIWAHNAHVRRGEFEPGVMDFRSETMGEFLDREHGEDYYALGFGVGAGRFNTFDPDGMELVTPPVPAPPAGSIPAVLRRLGGESFDDEPFFLSCAELASSATTAEWLAEEPIRFNISGMRTDAGAVSECPSDLSEFDGYVFVPETTPTTHLGAAE